MNIEEIYNLEHSETKRIIKELKVTTIKEQFDENKVNYYIITSNNFEKANVTGIILPGIPEKVAFWSYNLVKEGEMHSSSKYLYFKSFAENGWGLVNLTPHLHNIDKTGKRYIEQLKYVLKKISDSTKIVLIGYSFGGKITIEKVMNEKELMEKISCIILLDPGTTLKRVIVRCRELKIRFMINLSEDYSKYYPTISLADNILVYKVNCTHSELPNMSLKKIIKFIKTCFEESIDFKE